VVLFLKSSVFYFVNCGKNRVCSIQVYKYIILYIFWVPRLLHTGPARGRKGT